MKTLREEMTSAGEAAAKLALGDLGEALMQWWPAAMTADFKNRLSERVKSAIESDLDRILTLDLLGKNVSEVEEALSKLGLHVEGGDRVKLVGGIANLAVKRGGPGVICEVSAGKTIDEPLPRGNLNVDVHVSSKLRNKDREWETKVAIKVTVTGEWSWERDFGAAPTGAH